MAEDKKSFVAYSDWKGQFDLLSNEEAGILIKHILSYVNDENPTLPENSRIIQIAFEPIKLQLKRDLKKYESKRRDKSEYGIIGNLKRWHTDLYDLVTKQEITVENAQKIAHSRSKSLSDNQRSTPIAKIAVTVNDTVTVNDNVTVNDTVTVNDNVTDTVNDISLLGADAQKKTNYSSDLNHPVYRQSEKEKKIPTKKEKVFGKKEFREVLIELGAHPQHVDDWIKVRSAKRAVFTLTVLESLVKECNDNALPVSDAVRVCAEQNWQGFKFNWYQNLKSSHGTRTTETRQSRIDSVQELADIADSILAKSG